MSDLGGQLDAPRDAPKHKRWRVADPSVLENRGFKLSNCNVARFESQRSFVRDGSVRDEGEVSLRPAGAVRTKRPGRYLEDLRYDTVRGRTELLRLKCTAAAMPAESRTRPSIAPAPMPKSLQSNPRELATPGAVTVTKRALSPQIAR
jgi:hypothetical protein